MKKKHVRLLAGLAVFAALLAWALWGNTALTVEEYTVAAARLPEEFSGYRIAQISDLHNAQFGPDNETLLELLAGCAPDIIVITGDMLDSRRTDMAVALDFAQKAAELAPVYYVTGNHEARISEYPAFEAGLSARGVTVLRNETLELERNGQAITLAGVDDPAFSPGQPAGQVMDAALKGLKLPEGFTVLLSHRPELLDVYAANGVGLVFSGHAHGGQVRLPLIGALLAPNQGWFPQYTSSLYTRDQTAMAVSRGLGNSIIPLRINDRPELLVVTLEKA